MINTSHSGRREFLKITTKRTLATGVGFTAIETFAGTSALAADPMDASKPGMPKAVPTEELFLLGVIGPAELSLASSKLAVEKATQANARSCRLRTDRGDCGDNRFAAARNAGAGP